MKSVDKIVFFVGITLFCIGIMVFVFIGFKSLQAPTLTLASLTPFAILLSALIAAIAMFLSTRVNIAIDKKRQQQESKLKQFEFMMGMYNFYYTHEGIRSIRYAIEYNRFSYTKEFHGSQEERHLFALLRYFENIALLYKKEIISLSDIEHVVYDMKRVYKNEEVQKFFAYMQEIHSRFKTKSTYFNYLDFCKKHF